MFVKRNEDAILMKERTPRGRFAWMRHVQTAIVSLGGVVSLDFFFFDAFG